MKKLSKIVSSYNLLEIKNIDTDQIIPAVHLKQTERVNFGQFLFSNWRKEGKLSDKEFPLSGSRFEILVAGENFGCGSSREHAVWALSDYGFKAILSPEIADIFSLNALNNGLLPIKISKQLYQDLVNRKDENLEIMIDLENQMINISSIESTYSFFISPFKRECIIKGYDTVDYLNSIKNEIEEYEHAR